MERSDNVVRLQPPGASSPVATLRRREPDRGRVDALVIGSLLTGLAFGAQRLVLALGAA